MKLLLLFAFFSATFAVDLFYYTVPDFRRCAFPMCGGFFFMEVNADKTICLGKSQQCYVARANPSNSVANSIVLGSVRPSNDPMLHGFKELFSKSVWRNWNETLIPFPEMATLKVYRIKPGTPMIGELLNKKKGGARGVGRMKTVTIADFEGDADLVAAARDALSQAPILVAGTLSPASKGGKNLVISHLFRLVSEDTACTEDTDCAWSHVGFLITKRSQCFCPMCPTHALNQAAAERYEAAFQEVCGEWRENNCVSTVRCMMVPLACNEGMCGQDHGK